MTSKGSQVQSLSRPPFFFPAITDFQPGRRFAARGWFPEWFPEWSLLWRFREHYSAVVRSPIHPRRMIMSDDKTKTGQADRARINLSEDYEVRDWAAKFGVTEEALRRAAERVGPMAEDVRRELGGQ